MIWLYIEGKGGVSKIKKGECLLVCCRGELASTALFERVNETQIKPVDCFCLSSSDSR